VSLNTLHTSYSPYYVAKKSTWVKICLLVVKGFAGAWDHGRKTDKFDTELHILTNMKNQKTTQRNKQKYARQFLIFTATRSQYLWVWPKSIYYIEGKANVVGVGNYINF
jgi:hypothetical protein